MRQFLDVPSRWLDRLLRKLVEPRSVNDSATRAKETVAGHKLPREALGPKEFGFYEKLFEVLDAKSAALLTHISIMIAASVFVFYVDSTGPKLSALFFVLLLAFLLCALCLVRCLRFWASDLVVPDIGKEVTQ